MILIEASSILSDVIDENHQLIPILYRFGIKLGLGEKSVEEVCKMAAINTDFFLAILNTYLHEDYFPERKLQSFDIEQVIHYLRQTDAYLAKGQLHNLEKHLNAFIAMSDPANSQLALTGRLFSKFKKEINNHLKEETLDSEIPYALLIDLKSIFIKHISGNFNENLCYAVIFSIDSLQHDLLKHNRIRGKILKPMIASLVESGIDDWQELISSKKLSDTDKRQPISLREIEVLRLIALGLLNKEIADKLSISLNTVLSHRKNITTKLGIKTVSGLIFYCITHGYLSSDEIEI